MRQASKIGILEEGHTHTNTQNHHGIRYRLTRIARGVEDIQNKSS